MANKCRGRPRIRLKHQVEEGIQSLNIQNQKAIERNGEEWNQLIEQFWIEEKVVEPQMINKFIFTITFKVKIYLLVLFSSIYWAGYKPVLFTKENCKLCPQDWVFPLILFPKVSISHHFQNSVSSVYFVL